MEEMNLTMNDFIKTNEISGEKMPINFYSPNKEYCIVNNQKVNSSNITIAISSNIVFENCIYKLNKILNYISRDFKEEIIKGLAKKYEVSNNVANQFYKELDLLLPVNINIGEKAISAYISFIYRIDSENNNGLRTYDIKLELKEDIIMYYQFGEMVEEFY